MVRFVHRRPSELSSNMEVIEDFTNYIEATNAGVDLFRYSYLTTTKLRSVYWNSAANVFPFLDRKNRRHEKERLRH
jgi:hypothetical protein